MAVNRNFPGVGVDYPEYIVTTAGVVFYPDEYDDVRVTDKMGIVPRLECTLHTTPRRDGDTITAEALEGQRIRVYKVREGSGTQIFSGEITSAKGVSKKYKIVVGASGLAYLAQKRTLTKKTEDQMERTYGTSGSSLPGTPGLLSSEIIKKGLGMNQAFNYPTYDIDGDPDYKIPYRVESGNALQHLAQICAINFWKWWIEETDDETGGITVHCKQYRGFLKSGIVYEAEVHLIEDELAHDRDKVKTVISASGSSSAASNMASNIHGTFQMATTDTPIIMGHVLANESTLAESVAKNATKIKLRNSSDYLTTTIDGESLGVVQIGDEIIIWTEKDETDSNILKLKYPLLQDHSPDDDVLMVNLLKAYIPAEMSGETSFKIGDEVLTDCTVSPWGLENVTRGSDGYCHRNGTKIFPPSAGAGSSLSVYGRHDQRVSVIGASDHDVVDKYGISVLLALHDQIDYGYFEIALDDLRDWFDIGDWFYLIPFGETEKKKVQCTGFVYTNATVQIYFGCNDDALLTQFEDLQAVDDVTYCKDDKLREVTVLATSEDEKAVYVKDSADRSRWVRLR
jgi:hypothetical protein